MIRTFGFGAILALCLAASPVPAQSDSALDGKSTEELAAIAAKAIEAGRPHTDGGPISIAPIASHGHVVEMRTTLRNPDQFSRMKAGLEQQKHSMTAYFCKPSSAEMLKKGVILDIITRLANGTDQFEFIIDRQACEALANSSSPTLATGQLEELARRVVLTEKSFIKEPTDQDTFVVANASQNGGIVEVELMIHNLNSYKALLLRNFRLPDVIKGNQCARYSELIHQGLTITTKIKWPDGSTAEDFTLDKSSC